MKKLFLIVCFAMVGFALQAQNQIRPGIHIGLPIGDAGEFSSFNLTVEASYLLELSEEVQLGPKLGYSHSFGKTIDTVLGEIDVDDVQFLPVAASGHYNFTEELWFGLDLGYAIGISSGNDGGFYYSPQFAYGVSDQIDIVAAFRGISVEGGSWDVISLGVELGID